MKLKMKLFCAITVVVLLIQGCEKEKTEGEIKPPTQMELWNCHTQTVWEKETVFDELLGRWKWYYSANFGIEENGWNTESENTVIEFQSDSVLHIYVDGILMGTTNWSVTLIDPPLFGIVADSAIVQLHGRILFCDDMVEFNNSYIDGDDNYFKRID